MNRMVQTAVFIVVTAVVAVAVYLKFDLIYRGGPVMVPIVMCSIFSLTLMAERLLFFLFLHMGHDAEQFFNQMRKAIEARQWQQAEQLALSWPGPLGRIVRVGLSLRESTAKEIDESMEQTAHEELPAVERHMRWLSTLAQVSTLLGLLGTVTGLVRAFQIIQTKASGGSPVNPGDLAGGVWEALITTVAGLTVAIPTILAYNYFAGRINEVQFQMEKAAGLISGWRHLKS
ncbi:MAG: MotA/TolQ/ExbB proton channel family protein [Candidatus Omnitrophica bacterium]|nr:MotA/TolQ/ExbB proton channel family protein [Candidatus Omnitrophota bacterium]MBI2174361.1 MotA/TolQ/ExbB proton channel family protein [Candidatus Omnitrophota bacterium]MBI3010062.1 MotA/TolQ/ExbB proton channel family protein [Candidatus Omnitrophota bacterium]